MSRMTFETSFGGRRGANVGKSETCLFIAGERPYGMKPFCDQPTIADSSYCHEHHERCYIPFDRDRANGFTRFAIAISKRAK